MALALGIVGTILGIFSLVLSIYNTILLKVEQMSCGEPIQESDDFLGRESARALTGEARAPSIYDPAIGFPEPGEDPLAGADFTDENELD